MPHSSHTSIRFVNGLSVLAVFAALHASAAFAAPPAAINVHGQLIGAGGAPVTGTRAFAVQFHDAESGGNALGAVVTGNAPVSAEGLFNIAVEPPVEILAATEVWYSLAVDTDEPADSNAADDLFPSRIRVYSVPFALQAQEVVAVDAERVGMGTVDNTELDTLDGVNGNVQQQIDAIDTSGIATNTADIAQNTMDIAANTADIATSALDIADNTADIVQNTADIATNAADIATKANSADVYTKTASDTNFVDAAGDTMSGALGVDTLNESTADAGVTAEGILLKDSIVGLPAVTAPGDPTGKLYNVGGSLFFNGAQLDAATLDKDALNNSGVLSFDWTNDEVADDLTIQGGTVNNDSFSALSDLGAESAIGTSSAQVAAGDHGHALQNLSGAVTDAQVPDNITITEADTLGTVTGRGASTASNLTLSAASQSITFTNAAGTPSISSDAAAGLNLEGLNILNGVLSGAGQVQTAAGTVGSPGLAITGDPNTGLHAPGEDQLALVTGGASRMVVDNAEVNLTGNILEIAAGTAPGTTTNKLYNTSGDLFWNSTQINAGASATELWRFFTVSGLTEFVAAGLAQGYNAVHNGSTIRYMQFINEPSTRVLTDIKFYVNEYETYAGARSVDVSAHIRDIATGTIARTVSTSTLNAVDATNLAWNTLPIQAAEADRTIEPTEFLSILVMLNGTDGGAGEMDLSFRVMVE
ncbi:MAG: hypothetical protein HYV27_05485 [Candidatus Hydrogenedentes bacterium]|nr:hypothetical protein [Candidatus Hydrogenedentota bacterium]